MLILAVDTSTRTGSAAILRDSEVLAEISGYEETPYSTRLFRDLDLLQSRANFRMDQIDVFAVAAGPGSFTGLRVGLTAVKAWAEVHGKPIAAISGLEAIAAQSKALERVAPLAANAQSSRHFWMPAADKSSVQFIEGFRRLVGLDLIGDESILSLDEFLELVKGKSRLNRFSLVSPTPDVLPASSSEGRFFRRANRGSVSGILAPRLAD